MTSKDYTARQQKILDKFIADNPNIKNVISRKLIDGIGVNDSDYVTQPMIDGKLVRCKFYRAWSDMVSRCYSPKYQERRATYKGCTVCDEWLIFTSFKRWMENQNYEEKQLDKDILSFGNKVYSPETCIFVSGQVNSLLNNNGAVRGSFPQGVYLCQGKFVAMVGVDGKKTYLGRYHTIREAEAAYIKAKTANIIKVALKQKEERLKKALIMQASYMRVNFECKLLANKHRPKVFEAVVEWGAKQVKEDMKC